MVSGEYRVVAAGAQAQRRTCIRPTTAYYCLLLLTIHCFLFTVCIRPLLLTIHCFLFTACIRLLLLTNDRFLFTTSTCYIHFPICRRTRAELLLLAHYLLWNHNFTCYYLLRTHRWAASRTVPVQSFRCRSGARSPDSK